ncbi:MAG: hypothetical protein IPJ20_01485 [Flammeovirgaceae bacterium]|nr:hypothetical protein [Flammeovirgaceae bacterium]
MNVEEKYSIVKKIIQTEDDSILAIIKEILGMDTLATDWALIPDSVKKTIETSMEEIKAGKLISHTEVMADFKKWSSIKS